MSDSVPSAAEVERQHVAIVGAMGVGKSTLGEELAVALGRPHRDSDRDIESLLGRSGGEIAAEFSVERLHELERAVLLGALAGTEPTVIPVAIDGMRNVLPIGTSIPRPFKRITISYGKPFDYSAYLGRPRSKATAQELVDEIMEAIQRQLDEIRSGGD